MNDTPPESIGSPLQRRILTGTLWSMLGIAALGATRLAYTALIGRTGPPERLAEVNAQISLAFVATFVTAAATGAAASKFLPLTAGRFGPAATAAVRRRLTRWTALGLLASLPLTTVAGWWLLPGSSAGRLVGVSALVAAYGAYTFTKSLLYAHHLAGRYARLEVVADVATLAMTVIAVWWLPDLVLVPLILGYAGFAVAAAWSLPRPSRESASDMPELDREIGGFVAYTALGIVASQGFFQISMIVAGGFASAREAGLYAAAMSLVTPAFFLPRALALAFFPAAAEALGQGDRKALARQTETLTRLLFVTMLPVFAVAAMLGGPLLTLVFGPTYAPGGTVLAVLLGAVLLYVVGVPSVNALSAHELDRARIPPLASAVGVLVGVAIWGGLLLDGRFGAVDVAVGYLAGLVVQAGTPLVLAHRGLGLRWTGLGRHLALVAVAVGLVALSLAQDSPYVTAATVVAFLVVHGASSGRELTAIVRSVVVRLRGGTRESPTPGG